MQSLKYLTFLVFLIPITYNAESQTTHSKPVVTSKSVASKPVVTSKSVAYKPAVTSKSVAHKPVATSKSVARKPVATSKSVAHKPAVTSKPTVPKAYNSYVAYKGAKIQFENSHLDLGTLKEDAVVEKEFEFTNIGEKDLVIINTEGSCGCTVPTTPTLPIAPGEKGRIAVKYTARNKVGPQKPSITVTTNGTPSTIKLTMDAWVDQIPGGVSEK